MGRIGGSDQAHAPYLWVILITALVLGALYLGEAWAARRSAAQTASVLEPAFDPPGGYYDRDVQLRISMPHPGAKVIFTLDGSVPTHGNGTVYTHPIHLSVATPAVTVVRARTAVPGARLGPVVSASYCVGVQGASPMLSLILDPGDLTGLRAGENSLELPVDVTYVDQDRRSGFHIPAGVRSLGEGGLDTQSLWLYFRQEYGVSRLEYPIFAEGEVRSFKRLVLYNGGGDAPSPSDVNWALVRNQLGARLAGDLTGLADSSGLRGPRSRLVLLFVNGEPWGIYQIQEHLDRWFLMDHYNIESADLLQDPQWVGHQAALMGDSEHWDHLLQFVEAHTLADPANYAYVQTQVDVANLIDYSILQIYTASTDWPFHNVQQLRPRVQGGRWHWVASGFDQGLGTHPTDVQSNLVTRILDDRHPDTGGRDTLLLRRLLENPAFFERFLARTADLLNTTLAPSSVVAHIDALAAELEPDTAYATLRQPDSVGWEAGVEELRDFARRRPDSVRQHMVETFNLTGTAPLTFNPPASGSGGIAVNGMLIEELPWRGTYFQGIPIQVMAAPAPGYRFAGWDPPDLPQTPVITPTVKGVRSFTPRFEALDNDVPRPGDVIFTGYQADASRPMQADGFELRVARAGGADLRGWRVTDNDTKTATDEGSLILKDSPGFARVPRGTTILIIVPREGARLPGQAGGASLPPDDLNAWDGRMVLYAGNGNLDTGADPGFDLGADDNLVLLAPGPTEAFGDDQGIAFFTTGSAVTPASFGVLVDGVRSTP